MMKKERVIVFIDGFNLYHAIEKGIKSRRILKRHKWCDLRKLSTHFIDAEKQKIRKVINFTAYCFWNKEKKQRHKKYVKALKLKGTETELGKFRNVSRVFFRKFMVVAKCVPSFFRFILPRFLEYKTHEEKQTDVNIAIKIFELAYLDEYDHAFIVSGDSDLVPAIKAVKKHFPEKKLTHILPPEAKGQSLRNVCDFHETITNTHLRESSLPDRTSDGNGNLIIIPKQYT